MSKKVVSTILEFRKFEWLNSFLFLPIILLLSACSSQGSKATPIPTVTEAPIQTSTLIPSSTNTLTPTVTETLRPTLTTTPTKTYTASPTSTITLTSTPTPSGPAKVVASIPESIPCTLKGTSPACVYSYAVTFTESQGVGATITWMNIVYYDIEGYAWCNGRCEWDVEIRIDGNSSTEDKHWINGVYDVIGLPDRNFIGGRVEIEYKGMDDNGFNFSGKLSSKFEKP